MTKTKTKILTAGGLIAALVLAASPAGAVVDTGCMWSTLSAAQKTGTMDAMRRNDIASVHKYLGQPDFDLWAKTCGIGDEEWREAGERFAYRAGLEANTVDLASGYGADRAALSRAWNAPALAGKLTAARAETVDYRRDQNTALDDVAVFARSLQTELKLPEEALELVIKYTSARLLLEMNERP